MHIPYRHCTAHTLHACEIHPAHTPNMPYTCHKPVLHRLHVHCILATRMPYIGGTLSRCTHSWMRRRVVLHGRMPQAQCTYSICTHGVCMVHTRNTQAAHIPHSPASHMPHMSHTQVCCMHAKDTHSVHIACKLHATHACVHATLIYVACTLLSCTQHIPILHACTLCPHIQATCCCMFTSCKTHVNTFHECTN